MASTTSTRIKRYSMLLGGEWVSADKTIPVLNPATEEVISEIPQAEASMVDEAVQAASQAQMSWAKLPAIQRAAYLREISAAIRKQRERLARVITEEQGKILPLAQIEVDFSADYIDYMAEMARRYEGEIISSDRLGENILLYKAPIGVANLRSSSRPCRQPTGNAKSHSAQLSRWHSSSPSCCRLRTFS